MELTLLLAIKGRGWPADKKLIDEILVILPALRAWRMAHFLDLLSRLFRSESLAGRSGWLIAFAEAGGRERIEEQMATPGAHDQVGPLGKEILEMLDEAAAEWVQGGQWAQDKAEAGRWERDEADDRELLEEEPVAFQWSEEEYEKEEEECKEESEADQRNEGEAEADGRMEKDCAGAWTEGEEAFGGEMEGDGWVTEAPADWFPQEEFPQW
jgi:hypothetical protein